MWINLNESYKMYCIYWYLLVLYNLSVNYCVNYIFKSICSNPSSRSPLALKVGVTSLLLFQLCFLFLLLSFWPQFSSHFPFVRFLLSLMCSEHISELWREVRPKYVIESCTIFYSRNEFSSDRTTREYTMIRLNLLRFRLFLCSHTSLSFVIVAGGQQFVAE